jgi:hypothetical protein
MPTNYDTYTRSESDKDEADEERGGLSAQALHGTVAHPAPIEHVVTPPAYEQIVPTVRLPEGTLFFDRSNLESEQPKTDAEQDEDDDEDEEESEGRPTRGRQHRSPAIPEVKAASPVQHLVEQVNWPTEQDTKQAEAEDNQQMMEQKQAAPVESADQPEDWPEPPKVFARNHLDMPPPPAPGAGALPPPPPIDRSPAVSPDFNYSSPNMAPGPSVPAHGAYERPVASPVSRPEAAQPHYDNNRAVDGFARLMGVGNFIGNRRTRKKLSKQIELNRRETAGNFAGIQAQQLRATEQQRRQAQTLEQLRLNTERAPLPAAPFAASERTSASAPRIEYAPTYASQANANIPTQRMAEQGRPIPPHPPSERPRDVAPALAEQLEQQLAAEQLAGTMPEQHKVQSSWHEAVVDKHGNVIEGAKEYGQGFRQSRREVIRDRSGDAAAAGTTALAGIQQQQSSSPIVQYPGTLPSGMTSPTLPQGMPTHVDPQHQLPAQVKKGTRPGPIFWIMLAVIIAAFFATALI